MVRGERVIGAGESRWHGSSWSRVSQGDSFEALNEAAEDIVSTNWERGGAEHIASYRCWQ